MAIAFVGDIHGDFPVFANIVERIPETVPVVQVGDFGYWPYLRGQYDRNIPNRPFYVIKGNHDHPIEMESCDWPNARYMPGGAVEEIDGRRILFLGGATSVDRKWRPYKDGHHAWFDEEIVSLQDVDRALEAGAGGVDIMVTHTPPDWMIRKHFPPSGLMAFGHNPHTWRDTAAERVEHVWRKLGEPKLICGHMHRSVEDGQCRILDINEVVLW